MTSSTVISENPESCSHYHDASCTTLTNPEPDVTAEIGEQVNQLNFLVAKFPPNKCWYRVGGSFLQALEVQLLVVDFDVGRVEAVVLLTGLRIVGDVQHGRAVCSDVEVECWPGRCGIGRLEDVLSTWLHAVAVVREMMKSA